MVMSLTKESARLVRAERKVASQPNLPKQAEMRGFLDVMLGLEDRGSTYSDKLRVSYEQGQGRARKHRAMLDARGAQWWETDVAKDGRWWSWNLYREGHHVGSGRESSQVKAEHAAFDARMDLVG